MYDIGISGYSCCLEPHCTQVNMINIDHSMLPVSADVVCSAGSSILGTNSCYQYTRAGSLYNRRCID